MNAINAYDKILVSLLKMGVSSPLTFMSHAHLSLHGLEVIGDIRLDFSAHALTCPLLEAADSLVDVHGGFGSQSRRWLGGGWDESRIGSRE